MDNQDHRPISFPNYSHCFVIGVGFSLVILGNGIDGVKAESPQWTIAPGANTSIANSSGGWGNSPSKPSWQAITPTVEAPKEPIFITQAAPAKEPESFVPLHRRQGGESFVPNLLPIDPPATDGQAPEEKEKKRTSSPGSSIMIPSAYGSSWGGVGIGLGAQERVRFADKRDATMGLSLGLGDPKKNVGLQLGLGLTNLSDIFDRGKLSWKLHREIDTNDHIAIGGTSLFNWGGGDGGSSGYGVYTHRFELKEEPTAPLGELTISLGLGGGQFRKEKDIQAGDNYLGLFGGASLRVAEPVNAIVEWTGQDLTLGLSIAPFPQIPIVITPALTDLTGTAGDGTRFILGIGYGFML
jgi:hypothetical protein